LRARHTSEMGRSFAESSMKIKRNYQSLCKVYLLLSSRTRPNPDWI